MYKIAIVEDDEVIVHELTTLLHDNGYETLVIEEFKNVALQLSESKIDLVLLDVNIPYMNGEVVIQNLRKKSDVPVIMVTSRSSLLDEALSISYGADDYIVKPYNPNILLLRIGAVLKRANNVNDVVSYRDLIVDMSRGILKRDKLEIVLTKNEMIIFGFLLNHKYRIVTRDELMTALWDNSEYINDNALTVNISRLRSKLKELGYEDAIDTRKGLGYILS